MAPVAITTSLMSIVILTLYVGFPWARNVWLARTTGLPYVVVPYYSYNRITAMAMNRTLLRVVDRLLSSPSITSWRRVVTNSWPWKDKYAPFAGLGSDTFLTVAPGGIILNSADADVIEEVLARPLDFPKAAHLYRTVNIYGENVVSSQGQTWRHHRKLMSPAFSEKTNQVVWNQTLEGCQSMLIEWLERGTTSDKTNRGLADDTMRLSLGVIARAALGRKVDWPTTRPLDKVSQKEELSYGHKMTLIAALTQLLLNVLYLIILPRWLLKRGPLREARKAYESYLEWGQYMVEMIEERRTAAQNSETSEGAAVDLLSQLVKQQDSKDTASGRAGQSDSELKGNIFVMVLAGHETSASSIHFCLLLLALHPSVQKTVQRELDKIFQDRLHDCARWNYERDLPQLLNSRLAAVLNEELRLIGSIINIPKFTTTPQQLRVNGHEIVVPAKTMLRLCIPSVHSNPRFWSASASPKSSAVVDDLKQFKPERWINDAGNDGDAIHHRLQTPPPGAFIPFSDGARACLGRRFAQVEILAALALIMAQCSVELAVDEWATDEELACMKTEQKVSVWRKAEQSARWKLQNKMVCIITLQLRGTHVAVRTVKRGEERFAGLPGLA